MKVLTQAALATARDYESPRDRALAERGLLKVLVEHLVVVEEPGDQRTSCVVLVPTFGKAH